MTRPVICVETGGVLLGYRRCGAGIPMYVRVYPKRYGT